MRICFLMEPPRSPKSVTYDVIDGLKSGGADVDIVSEVRDEVMDLEHFVFDYDAYLFKSHSPLAESVAAAAHYRDALLINDYPATMKVRDKVLTSMMLLQAGLPTPRTFVTDSVEKLRRVVRSMPLVVKPFRGRRGEGIEFVPDESAFDELLERRGVSAQAAEDDGGEDGTALGDRLVLAQELVEKEPMDYKAYAIGDYVHAIKRVFPATTREEKLGTPVGEDPELDALVRRCGEVFGLELYGVDLVRTPSGYSVIEVNCFPGFKGVPEAGEKISTFILDKIASRIRPA